MIAAELERGLAPVSLAPLLLFLGPFTKSVLKVNFEDLCVPTIRACLPHAEFRISSLSFGRNANDSLLHALSQSGLAQQLLDLNVSDCQLTDESRQCWQRFSQLKTLNLGSAYLTMLTYDEVFGKLTGLTNLTLNGTNAVISPLVLQKILRNLNSLQEFSFLPRSDPDDAEAAIIPLLSANPALCKSLRFIFWNWRFDDPPWQLFDLCPNLRELNSMQLSWRNLRQLAPDMKRFESLRIESSEDDSFAQEDINWLAGRFPRLTSLEILRNDTDLSVAPFEAASLRCLSGLSYLRVDCYSWSCFKFPPSLTLLNLTTSDMAPLSFDDFIACLPIELTQLRDLELRTLGMTSAHLVDVLKSLPNLVGVSLPTPSDSGPGKKLNISHPSLKDVSSISSSSIVWGDMPGVTSLSVKQGQWDSLGRSMKSLEYVRVVDPIASMAELNRLKLLPALRSLSCPFISAACLDLICALSPLTSLALFGVSSLPEEALSALLKGLPRLRNLNLEYSAGEPNPQSFEWLEHDSLQTFVYRGSPQPIDAQLVPHHRPTMRFTALPSLLDLNIAMGTSFDLVVGNLPSLSSLHIVEPELSPAEAVPSALVRITNCPSLWMARFTSIALIALELQAVPSLQTLCFSCAVLPVDGCLFDAPSLRSWSFVCHDKNAVAEMAAAAAEIQRRFPSVSATARAVGQRDH